MVYVEQKSNRRPLALVVSGEACRHVVILQKLLGPNLVDMHNAHDTGDLLAIVKRGDADAVVVDTEGGEQELLKTLRLIRRVNSSLPVVLVAKQASRRFMEGALRLAAFSVVHKPLEREELLIQLRRIVERFYGG